MYPTVEVSLSRSRRFSTWSGPTPTVRLDHPGIHQSELLSFQDTGLPQPTFFPLVDSHLPVGKFLELPEFTTRLWKSKLNPGCLSPPHQNPPCETPSVIRTACYKWSKSQTRGRGYLSRGKKIGYERFESVRGECVRVNL